MDETLVKLTPAGIHPHRYLSTCVDRARPERPSSPRHHKRKLISALLIAVKCTCFDTLLMQGNGFRAYAILPASCTSLVCMYVCT